LFLEEISRCANIIKSLIKFKKPIIISHFDCDGLTSASIITKMFLRANINFELRIVKQLTSEIVKNLKLNEKNFLILTDLGSSQVLMLKEVLDKTQVFILDHHKPIEFNHLNLFYLNPLVFGEENISSSMICYLFAKFFDLTNTDLIDLAIVGAIADEQEEKWDFRGWARKFLEEAVTMGKITFFKGIRLYGRNTKPIFKALAYSFDPFIPEISGSESQSVQFLSELGIKIKENDEWKKLRDLTVEEQQKLASAIIIQRLKAKHSEAEDIFGNVYTLIGKPEEIQDAREFATLLNACGRTGNFDVAIRLCLGDFNIIERALEISDQYRKLISESLNWIRENQSSILKTEFGSYILADGKIPEDLIGTITSIVLNSNLLDATKPIFGFAESENGKIKVSARISRDLKGINLGDIIIRAAKKLNCEAGGHSQAAGAVVQKDKKEEFIKIVDSLLGETIGSKKS
jgi:RecJ-like exonuclease